MRRDLTPDLWTIRVRPAEEVRFLPGQYVALAVPGNGRMIERPYSIASAPHQDELEFFVELVPGGALTPRLYDLPVGGMLYLRRLAKGRFVLEGESGSANHLMVASVTGIAPYVSMLRDLARRQPLQCRVLVLHSASTPEELGYSKELTDAAREHAWLEYVPTVSRIWLAPGWPGERGRVEDVVRKYADAAGFTPANTVAYACGNPQMVRNIHAVMERAGFPHGAIREEMFWPPPQPYPVDGR